MNVVQFDVHFFIVGGHFTYESQQKQQIIPTELFLNELQNLFYLKWGGAVGTVMGDHMGTDLLECLCGVIFAIGVDIVEGGGMSGQELTNLQNQVLIEVSIEDYGEQLI